MLKSPEVALLPKPLSAIASHSPRPRPSTIAGEALDRLRRRRERDAVDRRRRRPRRDDALAPDGGPGGVGLDGQHGAALQPWLRRPWPSP